MRDTHLDNAKAALMVLVVLGHLLESVRTSSATVQALYLFLYVIHVPGLAFISGIFAHRELSWRFITAQARSLLAPFVAFEVLYELVHWFTFGTVSSYLRGVQPYWLLWFLVSLFVWRLAWPPLLRAGAPLVVAVCVSLLVSCIPDTGYFLGISRTVVFFPFFVCGALYGKRLLSLRGSRLLTIASIAVLVAGAYLAFSWRGIAVGWVYGSVSFPALGVSALEGTLIRGALYLLSMILVLALLFVLPHGASQLGSRAERMMYVYLWHGFVTMAIELSGVVAMVGALDVTAFAMASVSLSVSLYLVLSSVVVKRLTDRFLIEPVAKLLFL